jgi:hypothetical protein
VICVDAGVCSQFTARYLYSCPGTIVVQDLCAEGFRMAERRQGLDLSHSLIVMRMLARFHAASVVLHDRDPDEFSVYYKNLYACPETLEGSEKFIFSTYVRFICNQIHSVCWCID